MASNPRNMRVSVDRLALIAAIERKANQCKKEYERTGTDNERAVAAWKAKTVKEYRDAAKKKLDAADALSKLTVKQLVSRSRPKEGSRWSSPIKVGYDLVSVPQPREGEQFEGYNTILRMLRMSKKDSVSLSEVQFKAYMEGCPV